MKLLRVLAALALLAFAGAAAVRGGEPGVSGWASHYGPGHGVAMPFCTWTLRHTNGCGWVQIQSADTGLVVQVPVIDYCYCRVMPSSHPDRIVDLQWGVVDALGLERSTGLYAVTVWLIPDGPLFELPNTAAAEPVGWPLWAQLLIFGGIVGALLLTLLSHLAERRRMARLARPYLEETVLGFLTSPEGDAP